MGCVEPQDQPGNCFECGMKLLPTDGLGFETDQFGLTTTDQFGFKTDDNGLTTTDQFGFKTDDNVLTTTDEYGFETDQFGLTTTDESIKMYPQESVSHPQISVDPHKSVDTYLYFIEGHIP
jgi:hypothetical protein